MDRHSSACRDIQIPAKAVEICGHSQLFVKASSTHRNSQSHVATVKYM